MGRSALVIHTAELQDVVSKLEAATTYSSLGELCAAIEATAWAKDVRNEKHAIRGLSAQVAGREMKARGVICKTKPGQRGRASGVAVTKTTRSDKAAKLKMGDFPKRLREEVAGEEVPERYRALAELAIAGNPIAACKLKCGECMGYTGAEKACDGKFSGTPCPLYTINRLVYGNRRDFVKGDDGFYLLRAAKNVEGEAS